MTFEQSAYTLWSAFLVTWYLAALWTAKSSVKAAFGLRLAYALGFAVGFCLLFTPPGGGTIWGQHHMGFAGLLPGDWRTPLWLDPTAAGWTLFALELAAFAFAWWARIHLGKLWSGMLTLREGHRVVDTGPYRLVRHPIYTGFITGCWTLALIVATPAVLVGALTLTVVMAVKAKAEERFLRRELGEAAYDAYAARTPMLVPFAPR